MKLQTALELIDQYTRTKRPEHRANRYEIADAALTLADRLPDEQWAHLYSGVMTFLWQQQEDFIADQYAINQRLQARFRGRFLPEPLPGGPNIGWLLGNANFGHYAPAKHVHGFLSAMRRCYVYIARNAPSADWVRSVESFGHVVRIIDGSPPEKVRKLRECALRDRIGTLITDGHQAVQYWALCKRSAPVQLHLSPGYQFMPADTILLPRSQTPLVPNYERVGSPIHPSVLAAPYTAIPKPAKVVFGVLGRLEKISADYLSAVREILDRVPGSVFVAYGRGSLDSDDPRIYTPGTLPPGAALATLDVYLDTWPLCGGVSVYEAMAQGVPAVTLDHPSVASWNVKKPCVVTDRAAYIDAALACLEGDTRAAVIERGREMVAELTDCATHARELEAIIDRCSGYDTRTA